MALLFVAVGLHPVLLSEVHVVVGLSPGSLTRKASALLPEPHAKPVSHCIVNHVPGIAPIGLSERLKNIPKYLSIFSL